MKTRNDGPARRAVIAVVVAAPMTLWAAASGVGASEEDVAGQRLAQNTRFDGWRQYYGSRSHAITANRMGHFVTTANIDGIAIKLLVDTGASSIILSPRDADRIGIDVGALNFATLFSTGGGMARAAPVMLDEIQVGDFAVSNVRAYVIQTPSSISVLGVDFLNRLERYEVRGRELILHW